jgi:hypothetical protein
LASLNSQQWRKRGQKLRAKLVESDEEANNFVLSNDCDIEKYYKVADRVSTVQSHFGFLIALGKLDLHISFVFNYRYIEQVLEQFLHHPIDSREEILESYMVGNRLAKFLGGILPTHGQYFSKDLELARKRSQDQLAMVLKYLDQIALIIDKQEHQDYISTVLGADHLSNSAAGNPDISFDRSSVSTECLDNTTISSMASKIRQTSLSNNSSRAYHWHRSNEEKESSSSSTALKDKNGKGHHRSARHRNEISTESSILASSGTGIGGSLPSNASSSRIPLAIVSGKKKKNHTPRYMTTSQVTNHDTEEESHSRIVTPSSQHSPTKKKNNKLPEWPPKNPSSSSPSRNNIDKTTQNSPNRKTDILYLQYRPSKSSPPTINGEESIETSPNRKTDVLYLQYKPSNGLKMKKVDETSKRKHKNNEYDDAQVGGETMDSSAFTNTKHGLKEAQEQNGNTHKNPIPQEGQSMRGGKPAYSKHSRGSERQDGDIAMTSSLFPRNKYSPTKAKEASSNFNGIDQDKQLVDNYATKQFFSERERQSDGDGKSSSSLLNTEISSNKGKERNDRYNHTIQEEQSMSSTMEEKRQVVADEWHESYSRRNINHGPSNYPSKSNNPKHSQCPGGDGEHNDFIDDVSVASNEFQRAADSHEAKSLKYMSNKHVYNDILDDDSSFPKLSSKSTSFGNDNIFDQRNNIARDDGMPHILEEDGIPETSTATSDSSKLLYDPRVNQSIHSSLNDSSTKGRSLELSFDDRDLCGGDRYSVSNDFPENDVLPSLTKSDVSYHGESKEHSFGMSPPRYAPAAAEWSIDGSTISRDLTSKPKSNTEPISVLIASPTEAYSNSSSAKLKGFPLDDFKKPTRKQSEKSNLSEQYSTTVDSHPPLEMSKSNENMENPLATHCVDSKLSANNSTLFPWEDNRLNKGKSPSSRRNDWMEAKSGLPAVTNFEPKLRNNTHSIPRGSRSSGSVVTSYPQLPSDQLQKRQSTTALSSSSSSSNAAFDPFWSSKLSCNNGPILREEASAFTASISEKCGGPPMRLNTTTQQRVAAIALEPPPIESAYFESFFDNENRSVIFDQNNTDESNVLLRCPDDLKSFGSISRKSNSHKKRSEVIQDSDLVRPLHKSSTCSRIFYKHHHPGKQQEASLLSHYPTFAESTSEESSVADRKVYHHRSHFRGCVRFLLE